MNFQRIKVILYMLIIASVFDFTLPWPILNLQLDTNKRNLQPTVNSETRFMRQVVQPTWLNNISSEPTIDPAVHVNRQTLLEVAEIRKTIQKAVKEDTFAVADEQQDATKELYSTVPPSKPNATPDGLPNWYIIMQKFWHTFFKRFRN